MSVLHLSFTLLFRSGMPQSVVTVFAGFFLAPLAAELSRFAVRLRLTNYHLISLSCSCVPVMVTELHCAAKMTFTCRVCKSRFNSRNKLTKHLNSHTSVGAVIASRRTPSLLAAVSGLTVACRAIEEKANARNSFCCSCERRFETNRCEFQRKPKRIFFLDYFD